MSGPSITLAGVPVLRTDRLTLRGPETADFDAFAAYFASDRSRFTGGPLTRELAFRAFGHLIGHWPMRGYGFFVAEARETGRPIGMIGPYFPEGWPEPEIGWTIWDPASEGQGLAREGALAVRRFAYDVLGWTTAISLIDPANDRSIALARRMDCRPDGNFTHERYGLCHIWRHPGPEGLE